MNRSPAATLSKIDIVGKGFGFWNTIPTRRRTETTSTLDACRSTSSSSTLPSERAPGISSCMRLTHRTMVDLPQPDGPMIAVTLPGSKLRLRSRTAWRAP